LKPILHTTIGLNKLSWSSDDCAARHHCCVCGPLVPAIKFRPTWLYEQYGHPQRFKVFFDGIHVLLICMFHNIQFRFKFHDIFFPHFVTYRAHAFLIGCHTLLFYGMNQTHWNFNDIPYEYIYKSF
jgi:hypothetical protein